MTQQHRVLSVFGFDMETDIGSWTKEAARAAWNPEEFLDRTGML